MAFVSSPLPQEEQNQFSGTGQTTPNPMSLLPPQATQTGGSSGQGGGTSAAGTTPGVGTSTQFGSGASRLSDYLKANQDQVQGMANNIAGNIGNQYSGLQSGIKEAGQTFGSQVQGGYTPTDPTVLGQVQESPVKAASNPDTLSSFQKQLNSQYTGPSSFEASQPYQGIQRKVQDAVSQSQLLNTYPGLSTYLQNNVEKNATPGQNTLDTVLLQGNTNAYQTVKDAAKPFEGLTNQLGDVASQQTQGIQAAQQGADTARAGAQSALKSATDPFVSGINSRLGEAEQGYVTGQNTLNSYLKNIADYGLAGRNTQENQTLGVAPEVITGFSGLPTVMSEMQGAWNNLPALSSAKPGSLNDWTVPQIGAGPSASSIATPDDYAMLQALTSLGGNAPSNSPIDMANAAQAGTYNPQGMFSPTPNNKALGQDLFDYLQPWGNIPGATPKAGGNQSSATADYASYMNTLAQYLGLPAFNTNYPTTPPPVTQEPPSGPPYTAPPGGGRGI